MSRYIEVDHLKKSVEGLQDCYNGFSDTYDKACIIGLIDEEPTVDAVPVIHAEWEDDYPLYHCTNCRHTIMCHDRLSLAAYHRYCGRCGAMMSM